MIDWISVEDRLPEDGQDIIYQHGNGSVCRVIYSEGINFGPTTKHWYPYNPPVKRRWNPKEHERFYYIDCAGQVQITKYDMPSVDIKTVLYSGAYKEESEAIAMRDKIREFVSSQIGEC